MDNPSSDIFIALVARSEEGNDLSNSDRDALRLFYIYGEIAADGVEAYFERRCGDFRTDISVLKEHGLHRMASRLEEYRVKVFGQNELDPDYVWEVIADLSDSEDYEEAYAPLVNSIGAELDACYEVAISLASEHSLA